VWNALAEPSAAAQSAVLPQRDGEAVSGLIQRVLAVDLSGSHLKKTRMAWREGPAYSSRERVMEKEHTVVYGESNQRQEAREQFIAAMLEGRTFREVSAGSSPPVKRAMAYRLLRAVRTRGTTALQDGRHGHPSKLRGEARAFLEACCRDAPCTPSPTLQAALRERFDLQVSVSQINRVRAALGISNHAKRSPREKKRAKQGLLPHGQSGKKE
jgi:transposase